MRYWLDSFIQGGEIPPVYFFVPKEGEIMNKFKDCFDEVLRKNMAGQHGLPISVHYMIYCMVYKDQVKHLQKVIDDCFDMIKDAREMQDSKLPTLEEFERMVVRSEIDK